MDLARPETLTVHSVVFDVLADRAGSEIDGGVDGIVGGGFEAGGHLPLPFAVDTGRVRRGFLTLAGRIVADRLMQPHLRVDGGDLAQEVFHHIGVVDAHIEQHAALVFLMTPDGDGHAVAAAAGLVDHEAGRANGPSVEERFGQPVDGVAAIVLGHADDESFVAGGRAHLVAGAHGEAGGLFHHHMPAALQGVDGEGVVVAGRGGDVHGGDAKRGHLGVVGDHGGPFAEQGRSLVGQRIGVVRHRVTGRNQFKRRQTGALQLGQSKQVAVSHPAATDNGKWNLGHVWGLLCGWITIDD